MFRPWPARLWDPAVLVAGAPWPVGSAAQFCEALGESGSVALVGNGPLMPAQRAQIASAGRVVRFNAVNNWCAFMLLQVRGLRGVKGLKCMSVYKYVQAMRLVKRMCVLRMIAEAVCCGCCACGHQYQGCLQGASNQYRRLHNWRRSRAPEHLVCGQVAVQVWGVVKRSEASPCLQNLCMSLAGLQWSG